MKKKTFYSYVFGCRVNQAEKLSLDREMIGSGFKMTRENPAIFFINTCSITHKADREARNLIYRLRKKHPQSKIVITGCSATYWKKNELYQSLPFDMLVDNLDKRYLVKLIKKKFFNSLEGRKKEQSFSQSLKNKYLSSKRMMIKIQDGCHRFCTYCIVPYLRTELESIPINEVVKIINKNEARIKEAILTAINTEAYGSGTGETVIELIKAVLEKTKVERLSFGSIHPWTLDKKFLEFYRNNFRNERWIDFFHIPLQSGSNKILTLMKRNYTKEEFVDKLNYLHKINPFAFIATDVIVGFLGETEKDFEDTYNFLKSSPIVKFHIFRFSRRKSTASFYMSSRIKEPDEKTKLKRARALIKLGQEKYHHFLKTMIGRTNKVLFIGKRENGLQEGLLENQLPIWVKLDKNLSGEIKTVKILSAKGSLLFGKLV